MATKDTFSGEFLRRLRAVNCDGQGRRWAFIPYDQLNDGLGLLGSLPPHEVGIVLVETTWKPQQRRYHKQKLALLLASQRHFALEQAARGVAVRYLMGESDYGTMLRPVAGELGPLDVMMPAERELRRVLEPLVAEGALRVREHEGWMTNASDFAAAMRGKRQWRMDTFYRHIRKQYGWLMTDEGKPLGGKWSHDADNRQPWRGDPPAPEPLRFNVDSVTAEVVQLVEGRFGDHPGTLQADQIPAKLGDVEAVWAWTMHHCMTHFGPYEDAMTTRSVQLFHGRISGVMNLHRILPVRVVKDVLAMDIPINSKEGFVRQVVGWREFVRHIHRETDGFRRVPSGLEDAVCRDAPPLDATRPLPEVFWTGQSGLGCLDHVVREVWEEGYSHHINRLMVLANWATLLGIDAEEVSAWFWVAFEDAYDWVVEPNVLGMGTYAVGDLMVTKPYVSGSAYVNKMSDYCKGCAFDPKTTCPMTALYWDFLGRNASVLASNPRMRIVMSALRKRDPARRERDRTVAEAVTAQLAEGGILTPASLAGVGEDAA